MATHSAARRSVNAATLRLANAERALAETAAILRSLADYPDLAAVQRLAELVGLVRTSLGEWAGLAVPLRRGATSGRDGTAHPIFTD